MRRSPRLVVLVSLAASACVSSTDGGDPAVELRGEWRYAATQGTPSGASLAGTLLLDRQSGREFDGTLDVRETDGQGRVRQLAGIVTGTTTPDGTVSDFDAFLGPVGRRHVGTIRADTIAGNWIEGTGGSPASGTFRAERVR